MSFSIKWDAFSGQQDFQSYIRELLTGALNKKLPLILEDNITVLNLDWGSEAPSLEMLEIGDIAQDRFRGVFKLNYTGGATITVATKVQANLLNVYQQSSPTSFTMPKFVDAHASFPIPLHLTLRKIQLQGTVIVVFSKSKGLTMFFRNDPLQGIEVSSTFDKFPVIASFLQQQIETQIRALFREEVPAVLYQLSLKYLPSYNHSNATKQDPNVQAKSKPQAIAFADIESEKPVSLVNILHIEAMLSSRHTLALETPIMPTAIVRSELYHRAQLAKLKSPGFNLFRDDSCIYEQLFNHAKFTNTRNSSQKKPKRRVIKLRKKEDNPTELKYDSTAKNTRKHEIVNTLGPDITPEHTTDANSNQVSVDSFHKAEIPITVRVPVANSNSIRRIPVTKNWRDTKGITAFPLHQRQHLLLPYSILRSDEFTPLPVHEIDELPPAYVA